jgi:hypothetical protein
MRASLPTVGDAAALDRILPDHTRAPGRKAKLDLAQSVRFKYCMN